MKWNHRERLDVPADSPLSHSSDNDISDIFVCVMSLCDARNSTTSRFSFLIGTISKRHQNGVPAKERMKSVTEDVWLMQMLSSPYVVSDPKVSTIDTVSRKFLAAVTSRLELITFHGTFPNPKLLFLQNWLQPSTAFKFRLPVTIPITQINH